MKKAMLWIMLFLFVYFPIMVVYWLPDSWCQTHIGTDSTTYHVWYKVWFMVSLSLIMLLGIWKLIDLFGYFIDWLLDKD
jgi:hypothetical protein